MTLTVNPLDTPGYEFELTLSNPNPQFRKSKKDGAIRRVSFEITKEAWDLFAEARTDGMILAGRFIVTTVNGVDWTGETIETPGNKIPIENETPTVAKTPRHWNVGSLCQSAIELCNEPRFQKYMGTRSEAETSGRLKQLFQIESRKEIDTNPEARKKFLELMREYWEWNNRP